MTAVREGVEETVPAGRRVAVIVGRPNVGKSALFNRIVGRRLAIVHSRSGVTRDRLLAEAVWHDARFELMDTGGLATRANETVHDSVDAGIRQQVQAALEDAQLAILVVDIQAGRVPQDEEVAQMLREGGIRTVIAANKADQPGGDSALGEFSSLGFPVFPVSALHNRGMRELMDAVLAGLPPAAPATEEDPLKVAVVGRPNVGKSSYINRLLRSDRVIVSDVAGTTRDSIRVPFVIGHGLQARCYELIDTAGIRRVGKIKDAVERFSRFRAESSIREADVVALITDATQGPTAQDKKIAALVRDHGKGCVILANKWDLQEATQRRYEAAFREVVPFLSYSPLVFVSAKTGYNIRRSLDAIDHVAGQIRAVLPTGILNRVVCSAYDRVKPPAVQGKLLRIYYCTQIGTAPQRIRIFVNDPTRVQSAYERYLLRCLRAHFGLEGAPLELQFNARPRSESKQTSGAGGRRSRKTKRPQRRRR